MENSEKNNLVCLGPIEKIPLGQGHCFVVHGEEIAVFRPRSGGLYAIQNRCPHRQGPLCDGVVGDCYVICPYHARKFNLQTGRGGENEEGVKTYQIIEEAGQVFLKV